MSKKIGCVYFIKHIGLKPVKIGYSSSDNPINRINNFKISSPYGLELIGIIKTIDAKKLETFLHKKYKEKRLNGEWFNLSQKELKNELGLNFKLSKKIKNTNKEKMYLFSLISNKADVNFTEISKCLNVSRQTVYNWIKEYKNTAS